MPDGQQCDKILDAAIFAAKKHQGQVRKDQRGSPYVTHPMTVAKTLVEIGGIHDTQTLVAAILHDTIEDTPTTKDDLHEKFGEAVLKIVMEVTDDKRLPKMERKRLQVVHAPDLSLPARLIKLGDKLVNCRDILKSPPKGWDLTRRRQYIQWGADVLAQIRGTNAPLEDAFDAMLVDAEAELDFKFQPFDTIQNRPWAP
ncbi:HD domain-containing protein [bacterium]|nr:HD domain-containing protein [bacterium]